VTRRPLQYGITSGVGGSSLINTGRKQEGGGNERSQLLAVKSPRNHRESRTGQSPGENEGVVEAARKKRKQSGQTNEDGRQNDHTAERTRLGTGETWCKFCEAVPRKTRLKVQCSPAHHRRRSKQNLGRTKKVEEDQRKKQKKAGTFKDQHSGGNRLSSES